MVLALAMDEDGGTRGGAQTDICLQRGNLKSRAKTTDCKIQVCLLVVGKSQDPAGQQIIIVFRASNAGGGGRLVCVPGPCTGVSFSTRSKRKRGHGGVQLITGAGMMGSQSPHHKAGSFLQAKCLELLTL